MATSVNPSSNKDVKPNSSYSWTVSLEQLLLDSYLEIYNCDVYVAKPHTFKKGGWVAVTSTYNKKGANMKEFVTATETQINNKFKNLVKRYKYYLEFLKINHSGSGFDPETGHNVLTDEEWKYMDAKYAEFRDSKWPHYDTLNELFKDDTSNSVDIVLESTNTAEHFDLSTPNSNNTSTITTSSSSSISKSSFVGNNKYNNNQCNSNSKYDDVIYGDDIFDRRTVVDKKSYKNKNFFDYNDNNNNTLFDLNETKQKKIKKNNDDNVLCELLEIIKAGAKEVTATAKVENNNDDFNSEMKKYEIIAKLNDYYGDHPDLENIVAFIKNLDSRTTEKLHKLHCSEKVFKLEMKSLYFDKKKTI